MSAQQAQINFSEKLICMNSLSTFYFQPSILQLPPKFKFQTREELGLDPRINIYGCIQMSFKINRNYELMLNEGEEVESNSDTPQLPRIDLPLAASIPDDYIEHMPTRMAIYQK